MKSKKYPSINGLRAISILLVIMHHLVIQQYLPTSFLGTGLVPIYLSTLLQNGHLGVNIFFVISGFLITSLMQQEEAGNKSISLKKFYIRRTLRIFPAYFFLLLVYFFLQLFNYIKISNASWLTAITYTKYFNWNLDWYTSHAWSLSIEEHFYIFWPLVFIAGNRMRKTFAISLFLLVPIIRLYLHYHTIGWMNELTIFTRIDAIAIGCIFSLYKDEIIKIISPYWTMVFCVLILALFFFPYFPILASKIKLGFIFIPLGLTHGTIANVLIAGIMMCSVFGPQGIWFKILNLKIMNYIGLLSYSIYLWQEIFICRSEYWVNKLPQNIFFFLLVAAFSYHVIEMPFLKLKSKFSNNFK
jgi:peptidoglycan/LPS O-acetylase OafA/YrhL